MPKLVKYSTLKKRMSMRFLKKKYIESNYSILYDAIYDDENLNHDLLGDIENLVMNKIPYFHVHISDIQAKNIYFLNEKNLGGITIPFNIITASDIDYCFDWNEKYPSNIDKINIIFNNNNVKTINIKNAEKISFSRKEHINISLKIEDNKSIIEYIMNNSGNTKTVKKAYYLTKEDIKDNKLDLSNYIEYEEIIVDIDNDIKVNNLIINKECMKKLYKLYDAISYIHYNKLTIIDDNQMKLLPSIIELTNEKRKGIEIFQSYNNTFYILQNREKLIYNNKLEEIKVIDKEKLLKDKNIEKIDLYLEDNYHIEKQDPLIIIKYKNNKTKISHFDEEYIEINKLFKEFNLYNIYKYYHHDRQEIENLLIINDWYTLFEERYIDWYKLKQIHEDYVIFIEKLKKLHNIGFTSRGIRYLYENNFNNIIYSEENKNEDNLKYQNSFNIEEMTSEEINKFNELGNIYIKRKELKK